MPLSTLRRFSGPGPRSLDNRSPLPDDRVLVNYLQVPTLLVTGQCALWNLVVLILRLLCVVNLYLILAGKCRKFSVLLLPGNPVVVPPCSYRPHPLVVLMVRI